MNKEFLKDCGVVLYGSQFQTDLAKSLDVSARTIRRWISGESDVSQKEDIDDEITILIDKRIKELELLKKMVMSNNFKSVGYSVCESVDISVDYKRIRIGGDVQSVCEESSDELRATPIAELSSVAVRLFKKAQVESENELSQ